MMLGIDGMQGAVRHQSALGQTGAPGGPKRSRSCDSVRLNAKQSEVNRSLPTLLERFSATNLEPLIAENSL